MGRRARQREKLRAPSSDYSDPQGNVLTLRGALSPGSRRQYADALAGGTASAAATREDSDARAVELLFEHLAVRWLIAGVPLERQRELLARFRIASAAERSWVQGVLREHCSEHFPELQLP